MTHNVNTELQIKKNLDTFASQFASEFTSALAKLDEISMFTKASNNEPLHQLIVVNKADFRQVFFNASKSFDTLYNDIENLSSIQPSNPTKTNLALGRLDKLVTIDFDGMALLLRLLEREVKEKQNRELLDFVLLAKDTFSRLHESVDGCLEQLFD
jgi:hypothetical protein